VAISINDFSLKSVFGALPSGFNTLDLCPAGQLDQLRHEVETRNLMSESWEGVGQSLASAMGMYHTQKITEE
jgi:hypothetical protein